MVNLNLISYFPLRVCNGIYDLAETIMIPANCRSCTVNLPTKNFNVVHREHLYTDIMKTNFSWKLLLTSQHFPSVTDYH